MLAARLLCSIWLVLHICFPRSLVWGHAGQKARAQAQRAAFPLQQEKGAVTLYGRKPALRFPRCHWSLSPLGSSCDPSPLSVINLHFEYNDMLSSWVILANHQL